MVVFLFQSSAFALGARIAPISAIQDTAVAALNSFIVFLFLYSRFIVCNSLRFGVRQISAGCPAFKVQALRGPTPEHLRRTMHTHHENVSRNTVPTAPEVFSPETPPLLR